MAGLNELQKTYIVQSLARFMQPSEVVAGVKEHFDGLEVTRQQVRHYNPTQNRECAGKWKDLFDVERKAYVENLGDIGIANTSFRLDALERMARKAEDKGNFPLAASLHEQAAKDRGGVFTNHQRISGRIDTTTKHSGEVKHEHSYSLEELRELPADELVRVHRDTLGVPRASRWK